MSLPAQERAVGGALDELYWRAEILQALYWMRGEGLAAHVTPDALARFMAVDQRIVADQLCRLTARGYLERPALSPEAYALTTAGVAEGGRAFRDEFQGLTRPAHYACGPGCWCHDPDHVGEPCPGDQPPVPDDPPSAPAEESAFALDASLAVPVSGNHSPPAPDEESVAHGR